MVEAVATERLQRQPTEPRRRRRDLLARFGTVGALIAIGGTALGEFTKTFTYSNLTPSELTAFVQAVLIDPTVEDLAALSEAGVSAVEFGDLKFSISEPRQGAVLEVIAISIASTLGADVLRTIWEKVIWRRIERRFGRRSLDSDDNA